MIFLEISQLNLVEQFLLHKVPLGAGSIKQMPAPKNKLKGGYLQMKFRNLYKNQKGQAVVEFALILPVLMLIICGLIEGGWMFSNQLAINNASREGARIGVIYSKDSNQLQIIQNKVLEIVPNFMKDKVSVLASYTNPTTPRSGDISVDVTYNVTPLTPITSVFIGDDFKLSSKCIMKLE